MTAVESRANPYVGPRSFRTGERLYGRASELRGLADLLIAERIVVLFSPSGAGKSSLLLAGLVPQMRQRGFTVRGRQDEPVLRVNLALPVADGAAPATNRYVLSTVLALEEEVAEDRRLPASKLTGLDLASYLEVRSPGDRMPAGDEEARANGDGAKQAAKPGPELWIFDQFEEILTLDSTDLPVKEAFFEEIGEVLADRRRWAVFSLREDYWAGLDPYLLAIPTQLSTTFRLELLDAERAAEAIRQPAKDHGADFTLDATRRLVDDLRRVRPQRTDEAAAPLGPFIEPVQLQIVCRRLWTRWADLHPGKTTIDEGDVAALADVDGALGGFYTDAVKRVVAETGVEEREVRRWFDEHLITKQGFRGHVLEEPERSGDLDNRAIKILVDEHVVRKEAWQGRSWYELAHDRLVEPVLASNGAWYQSNLSSLQLQAKLWASQGEADAYLLTGAVLEEAERWAKESGQASPTDERFLKACRDREARERAEELRITRLQAEREAAGNRKLRKALAGAAVCLTLALVALGVAGYYYHQG
jgi:hypothetical protein